MTHTTKIARQRLSSCKQSGTQGRKQQSVQHSCGNRCPHCETARVYAHDVPLQLGRGGWPRNSRIANTASERCTKIRLALQTSSLSRPTHHEKKWGQPSSSHHNNSTHTPEDGVGDGAERVLKSLRDESRSDCSCASPSVSRRRASFVRTTLRKRRPLLPVNHR
jgi:hypothetical protein